MSRFPLFTAPVSMIGRSRVFDRMASELTKPTPQSLSLVGPRFFGKSVLLEELATKMRSSGSFECVLQWDLGHQTPNSDEEFMNALQQVVAEGLKDVNETLSDHLTQDGAGYDELVEVVQTLDKEGKRILMLWDGFDRALLSGKLTRNLWDNMLALGKNDGLVLVTSTRKKLQELIRDAESVTSEFWLLFDVVRLEPLDETDIKEFADSMTEHQFSSGALSELSNWSGGIPPVLVWLLNKIEVSVTSGSVGNDHVNTAASQLDELVTDLLETLWSDCPAPAADLYRLLADESECAFASCPRAERALLIESGLASQASNKLRVGCRLMSQHISGNTPGASVLGRLFGTWEDYRSNIRGILERRIAHVDRFDETLFHMVERGIDDIPAHPDVCLANLTHIEDKALDLIWAHETETNKTLPTKVVSHWSAITLAIPENHRDWLVNDMMKADEDGNDLAWRVPSDRTHQLKILQFLTGSHQKYSLPVAKSATKDTYVLLNAIHTFRNRSEHADGQSIDLGVAVSAIMLCIELLGCLGRELAVDASA